MSPRLLLVLLFLIACGAEDSPLARPADAAADASADAAQTPNDAAPVQVVPLPARDAAVAEQASEGGLALLHIPPAAQRAGDAAEGYRLLINGGYVGCGVPIAAQRIASLLAAPAPADVLSAELLPERTGSNASLPYYLNAFSTASGVEVVSNNCLFCHAARLNGKLVIGLGASSGDFTTSAGEQAAVLRSFLFSGAEQKEFDKWYERLAATAPYLKTLTLGANPADRMADILFAHRDPITLSWLKQPSSPLMMINAPPADVPPWWRTAKKSSLYYSGLGRGDHTRWMMTASSMCIETVAEARAIDAYFPHVRAYIASLLPPPYPEPVDEPLRSEGEGVFLRTCARCHGTYGAQETYPNLLIPAAEIGTDPLFALGGPNTQASIDWLNRSFYGEIAQAVLDGGYTAPPLDGIWATAPFLHNGSVPTIALLLESSARPSYWTRSYRDDDLDYSELGFRYQRLISGQASEPDLDKRKRIYDTTLPGYSNAGHRYGDALSKRERSAVIEYLKTL